MNTDWRSFAAGALGAIIVIFLMAQMPMTLRDDGIQFPDGTVQTTAAISDTRLAYYMSLNGTTGSGVLSVCGDGFHTASLWEILDVSNLRYAKERSDAFTREDAGYGPPSGLDAWVRTGRPPETAAQEGRANCDLWTSNSPDDHGSVAELEDVWSYKDSEPLAPGGFLGPWDARPMQCDQPVRVWCVQD